MTPDVTVVIPTRDRWPRLAAAGLASALAQEDVALEVVVVDDGSTDGTAERVRALEDPRVRVLRHEAPRGVAAARNTGIAAAAARWVAFLDDDDLWSPRKLAVQLAALERSGASLAYCAGVALDDGGGVTGLAEPPPGDALPAALLQRNVLPAGSSNVVVARELLQRVGGFDEELSYLADWDLWLRLVRAGEAVACPEALVGYVRHRGRMSLGARAAAAEVRRVRAKHAADGVSPDARRFLAWIAAEHRRAGRRRQAVGVYARAALVYRDPRQLLRAGATLLDWRGAGLRRLLGAGRPTEPGAPVASPDWLRGR